ncbi:hypothetical protein [Amycolatopsis sp. CA-230715]|uniref:hypothetical protein n=1 Tax=Amycolatopsis sp. CA-230715 TaxID=2745196 RepID=UPI001C015661|nr:hypothetical protein [Amycolatopsis sp. CA-230715]QWF83478.1 hypothetical protein HUW46_06919 [Amycolatopsis sp. CA-230715]
MYRRIALGAGVLLAVTGCGGGATGGETGAPPPPAAGNPASAASSSPAKSTGPAAADGTDFAACADGVCEVLVAPGDKIKITAKLGLDTVTVDSVSPETVKFSGDGPGIHLGIGEPPGPGSTMNKLRVTVVSVDGGKAVVRLAPK